MFFSINEQPNEGCATRYKHWNSWALAQNITANNKNVIDICKSRRIERFGTARAIANGLSSRGPATQKHAIDKLKFYVEAYILGREALPNPVPNGTNRLIEPLVPPRHVTKSRGRKP